MKKIVVVGLGLIGGSLAAALKGFEDYVIVGANRSRAAVDFARERSMADVLTNDIAGAVRGRRRCDLLLSAGSDAGFYAPLSGTTSNRVPSSPMSAA